MNQQAGKLAYLEGLRGIAAFVVVLTHLHLMFFIVPIDRLNSWVGPTFKPFIEAFYDGNFAVWLFWVMSAFVLSLRYHATKDVAKANGMLTDASIRRYPRLLLPVLVSVVFAYVLHAGGLMSNVQLANQLGPEYADWLGHHYQFEAGIFMAIKTAVWQCFFNYNPDASYNRVLWTMEVELMGSFFLFAYLSIIGKHKARWLIYAITAVVLFRLYMFWVNAFVLGTMLCDMYVNAHLVRQRVPAVMQKMTWLLTHTKLGAMLTMTGFVYLIGLPNINGMLHLVLATALTGYLIVSPVTQRFFARPYAVFLGKISFGLYLIHTPFLCAAAYPTYMLMLKMMSASAAAIVTATILAACSLVLGWGLWFVADKPAVAFSRAFARFFNQWIPNRFGSPDAPQPNMHLEPAQTRKAA
ncbi:MAG: acyltransferase family protein [Phycisphaeraceae bacterium JB051]